MSSCDHVAFVVRDLEGALTLLSDLGAPIGPVEDFPSEGTREVYVGAEDQAARILLMQSTAEVGPYARALAKRGPGLHHLAFHTPSAKAFCAERPGWLMLPQSLETFESSQTIWLARPGVGTLLEVHEGHAEYRGPPLVDHVEIQAADLQVARLLLSGLGAGTSVVGTQKDPKITIQGKVITVRSLVGD